MTRRLILPLVLAVAFPACNPREESTNTEPSALDSPETTTDVPPTTFRFDFSDPSTRHRFDYSQFVEHLPSPSDSQNSKPDYLAKVECTLVLHSKGDRTADVELANPRASDPDDPDGEKHELPSSTAPGMGEDGSSASAAESQNAMMSLLFPLPSEAMSPGETTTRIIRFPNNFNGVQAYVPIRTDIRLDRYEQVGDLRVACFEVKLEGSEIKSEQELPGHYTGSFKGTASYRFNPDKHTHHGGSITFTMENGSEHGSSLTKTTISFTPVTGN